MGDLFQSTHLIILLLIGLFIVAPFWQIFKKAGYAPALSFLMLIPYVNLGIFLWLAFSDWPVLKKSRQQQIPPTP